MLSIVNYGSSDSENEITDEEDQAVTASTKQDGENKHDEDILAKSMSTIKLPAAQRSTSQVIEEDDEFLHKKEVPEARPPPAPKPREKVKIMIPKLSDFGSDEDDDFGKKKVPTASNKKTGLLGMLPKPTNSIGPSPKPQIPIAPAPSKPSTSIPKNIQHPGPANSSSDDVQPKKIGLIPYALMDHKIAADSKKVSKKKGNESDSDEEESTSFFTFSSNDDLPAVSEEEIKSLIATEASRLERKRQNENSQDFESDQQQDYAQYSQQQLQPDIDRAAISALVGGNKAKRSKFEDIQIVDLSANDVLPDREEWIRKTLAGETGYIPTGQIDEKVSEFFSHFLLLHTRVYTLYLRVKNPNMFC
jgi:proline-rich protein PRCC